MQTIYLDISNRGVIPCIYAKQGEVGRKFIAIITDNGLPYNIPTDSLMSVWYSGDTDVGNYSSIEEKSAFSIDGNKVVVELVAQMLLKPGNGEMCLSISHADGGETNTWNIPYCAEYKPGAGSAVPTEYYTALTDAAARAAEQVSAAREQAEIAREQADIAKEAVEGYVKADGSVELLGDLSVGYNRITNLGEPVAENDAVNVSFMRTALETMMPIGYTFTWNPLADGNIHLDTAENVAQHFGFGVWEQVKDTFILAAGDKYAPATTGGEETHTLTIDEMPQHNHNVYSATTGSADNDWGYSYSNSGGVAASGHLPSSTGILYSGGGQPFNIMPKYTTMYVWTRIA